MSNLNVNGDALLAADWWQGTLFHASTLCFSWHDLSLDKAGNQRITKDERQVKASEKLVLISQDCDIKAPVDKEPFVEALVCKRYNQKFVERVSKTSARWFVINPAIGLVAEAKYRITLAKPVLSQFSPEPWPSSPHRLDRFIQWLARRYDRPAIPDAVVDAFQKPFEKCIADLRLEMPKIFEVFNRIVSDIRISLPPNEIPPFELHLVLLIGHDGLSKEEANAIDIVKQITLSSLDANLVHLHPDFRVLTEEEISLKEFYATRPVYLDYHTFLGEEIDGAEPHGRV
jgi:hypothetical protein